MHTIVRHGDFVLGFDWIGPLVGAAAMLGLVLLAAGVAGVRHRRATRTKEAAR